MKVKVVVPKTGLRARNLGRIKGIAPNEYEVSVVATLTDADNESSAKTTVFKQVASDKPINPKEEFLLVSHDSADGELILTVTATISMAGYSKLVKEFSKGAGTLMGILGGIGGMLGANAPGALAGAMTATKISQQIADELSRLMDGMAPTVTIVERRVLHPQPGARLAIEVGTPTKTRRDPPSDFLLLAYEVHAS